MPPSPSNKASSRSDVQQCCFLGGAHSEEERGGWRWSIKRKLITREGDGNGGGWRGGLEGDTLELQRESLSRY